MRKFLKVVLWLLVVVVAGVAFLAWSGSQRPNKVYGVSVTVPDLPIDSTMMARGEHLSKIWGCTDCHGANFGGMEIVPDDNPVAHVIASNLTSGAGGIGSTYTDEDWARAIRFGVKSDGRPAWIMPSQDFTSMSDYDIMALVNYLKQVPPVDNELPKSSLGPLGRVLAGIGELKMWEAEHIDFNKTPNNSIVPAVSVEYGAYLGTVCTGCHGANLKGGKHNDPNFPLVPDLTATGESASWTKEQVITAMTTGVRPDGREMSPMHMPWSAFQHMSEMELDAVYMFLRTLE
jgi:cytochrome c553